MHARLDYWIVTRLQKYISLAQVALLVSAQNEMLLWLMGMKDANIRTHCKDKHKRPNMVKRGRMYSKQN